MKLIDINTRLRSEYKDTIIFMKYGNFYRCFYNDALVMNYVFNYKLNSNKIGFPINIISSITDKLDKYNIDYLIFNTEINIVYNIHKNNNYINYLELGIKKSNKDSLYNDLCKKIKFLLDKDINNYEYIKRVLNEL